MAMTFSFLATRCGHYLVSQSEGSGTQTSASELFSMRNAWEWTWRLEKKGGWRGIECHGKRYTCSSSYPDRSRGTARFDNLRECCNYSSAEIEGLQWETNEEKTSSWATLSSSAMEAEESHRHWVVLILTLGCSPCVWLLWI